MLDTRPTTAPVETVTPIKPSEALRLGRLVRPTRTAGYLTAGTSGACALGAMHFGIGMEPDNDDYCSDDFVLWFNTLPIHMDQIAETFDVAEYADKDGDAAVLAFLEERGL